MEQFQKNDEIRQAVRQRYGSVAKNDGGAGCGCGSGCCEMPISDPGAVALGFGYSAAELAELPDGANMGLGCGNPQAIAAIRPGETVLDLGSGGGFDCFLAARQVGETGRVIGVDMTPEMVVKARANAAKGGFANVEFRLGEIEHLPVADKAVDVILSNCVINLSPDKKQVFAEAWRVLKPGGRLAISDVVATRPLPEAVREDLALYTGCLAGASLVAEVEAMLWDQGFTEVRVAPREESRAMIRDRAPDAGLADYVVSAAIEAVRPGG